MNCWTSKSNFWWSGQSFLKSRQKNWWRCFPPTCDIQQQRRHDSHSTFADTCMLFSCMFMMASEILTSIGSMTDSMLNGPSNLSATRSIASVKTQSSHSLKEGIPLGTSGRPALPAVGVDIKHSWAESGGMCGRSNMKPAGQLPSCQKYLHLLLPPQKNE